MAYVPEMVSFEHKIDCHQVMQLRSELIFINLNRYFLLENQGMGIQISKFESCTPIIVLVTGILKTLFLYP